MGGTAEGRLGVDDPRLAIERSQEGAKGAVGLRAVRGCPGNEGGPRRKASRKPATSLPRKSFRSTGIGRKKRGRAWTHRVPSGAKPPIGTTQWTWGWCCSRWPHVWSTISPPMAPPKRFGFARDLEQGVGGGLKQQVVHHALVDERETGERLRDREDDVDVADWEELLLASRHPRVPRRGQTLRAMPITAAVVRESRLRTLLTAIAVPAERRRAALRDGPEDASMRPRDPGPVRLQDAIAMSAHDVGHLEGWPRHRLCSRRVRRTVSAPETGIASSGLATAWRCRCDKCR